MQTQWKHEVKLDMRNAFFLPGFPSKVALNVGVWTMEAELNLSGSLSHPHSFQSRNLSTASRPMMQSSQVRNPIFRTLRLDQKCKQNIGFIDYKALKQTRVVT